MTPAIVDVWNTGPYNHDGGFASLLQGLLPCDSGLDNCSETDVGKNIDDQHGVGARAQPGAPGSGASRRPHRRVGQRARHLPRFLGGVLAALETEVNADGKEIPVGRVGGESFELDSQAGGILQSPGCPEAIQRVDSVAFARIDVPH